MSSERIVYSITERGGRTHWTRIGVAFVNGDGSLRVELDLLPLNGRFNVREPVVPDNGKESS